MDATGSLRERMLGALAGGLLAGVRRLPRARAVALGGMLGRAWVRAGGPRTRVGLVNLRIAFPEWSEARRRSLLEASFANTARSVAEVAYLSRLEREDLAEMVRYEGLEHLESALAQGRGVIGLSAHFGNFELLAVAMAMRGLPLAIVHRERRPALESHVRGWRERGETEVLPRGSAARSALRALRAGRAVAMLMDQDTPREEGVFAPFFSLLACTRDAPVRIALRTGAPVVPLFIFREGTSTRHVVRCQPPLELVSEGESREAAIRENVRRVNGVIEAAIRRSPEMWTWNHRRWRTQPPGEPRPYPPRRRERREVL